MILFHPTGHRDIKICGDSYLKYYSAIEKNLLTIDREYYKKCNCLNSCTSLDYFANRDSVKFNMSAVNEAKGSHSNQTG